MITFFSPYGTLIKESGFMYMFARYISTFYSNISQLKCNGLFTICSRDYLEKERRDFLMCSNCMACQDELANWSEISSFELSKCLRADALRYIKKEFLLVPDEELNNVYYEELNIYDLCRGSFFNFVGNEMPDISNKKNLQLVKKIMLSSIKVIEAIKTYYSNESPSLFFIPSSKDFLTHSILEYLKIANKNFVEIDWSEEKNIFSIINSSKKELKQYEIYIDSIIHFRNDCSTWPEEFINMLNDVANFVGLSDKISDTSNNIINRDSYDNAV
ncbi:MAG: hypothetical protein ACOX3T_06165 [Bdellovibrionota bacterium]